MGNMIKISKNTKCGIRLKFPKKYKIWDMIKISKEIQNAFSCESQPSVSCMTCSVW